MQINGKQLMRFVSFMLILTTFLPIVYANLPRYITGFNLWAPIWFLSLLIFSFKTLRNRSVLFLIIYHGIIILLLFNTIWSEISDWQQKQTITEFYNLAIPVTMVAYFFKEKDFKWMGKIGLISTIFILITIFFTLRSSILIPGYARMLFSISLEEIEIIKKLGGGGYGFSGFLICYLPILVYYFKNSKLIKLPKWIILGLIIFVFATLVQMQFFANVILAVFVFILSLAGGNHLKTSIIPSLVIVTILLLIPVSIYSQFFIDISNYFSPYSDIHNKFQDFAYFLEHGEIDSEGVGISGRAGRYPVMFELFLSSPLFGFTIYQPNANTMGGEHLYWINKLAVFGLLGFVPFIIFYYKHFFKQLELLGEKYRFYCLLSILSVFALGFMKVLAGREMWIGLFFIIPSLYYLPLIIKRGDPLMKKEHFSNHYHQLT